MDIMTEEFLVNLDVGQDMGLSQEGRGGKYIYIIYLGETFYQPHARTPTISTYSLVHHYRCVRTALSTLIPPHSPDEK